MNIEVAVTLSLCDIYLLPQLGALGLDPNALWTGGQLVEERPSYPNKLNHWLSQEKEKESQTIWTFMLSKLIRISHKN